MNVSPSVESVVLFTSGLVAMGIVVFGLLFKRIKGPMFSVMMNFAALSILTASMLVYWAFSGSLMCVVAAEILGGLSIGFWISYTKYLEAVKRLRKGVKLPHYVIHIITALIAASSAGVYYFERSLTSAVIGVAALIMFLIALLIEVTGRTQHLLRYRQFRLFFA